MSILLNSGRYKVINFARILVFFLTAFQIFFNLNLSLVVLSYSVICIVKTIQCLVSSIHDFMQSPHIFGNTIHNLRFWQQSFLLHLISSTEAEATRNISSSMMKIFQRGLLGQRSLISPCYRLWVS